MSARRGRRISFRVLGIPRPQGSKVAFARNGRAWMKEAGGDALKTWRSQVYASIVSAFPSDADALIDGPVRLEVLFILPRPKKPKAEVPLSRPDLSKLVRALEDELTGTVVSDDSRIVSLVASKVWSSPGSPPGAVVTVEELDGAD